ncbi:antibiotic biosynthesis monooxygenase family protein [Arthrobacter sp. NPDC057009]|uniref:antibiotic biosynthesis monooxygenase family protein n=1 Tax=Arthrobacter sp. NPDC057009 TaxID=3345996 RepID=UPI003640EA91
MELVLFRIHTREDIDQEEYEATFARMLELVAEIPGFISIEGFSGADGSELAVAQFESAAAIEEWRDHPEHVRTQQRGRDEFFESYEIRISTMWKTYGWSRRGEQS